MMKKVGLGGKMSPNAAAVANGALKREPSNMSCATTDSDEVCFQDAMEDIPTSSSMDLYESIRETQIALSLFLNNRFDEARARMEPLASQSMYHALGYSTIIYIRAMMTCEREDIEKAMKVTKDACSVCDRFRYRWTLTDTVTSRIVGGSQRILTDEEMHAELCYAECLLLRALLTFVQDENLSSFVKGAMKIRSCYQSYRECQRILQAQQWNDRDPMVRAHFESGTRMGVGTFNLMISTLPSRILKLLEFVGFSGDKNVGLTQLHTAAAMQNTLRSPLCALVLLCWHLIGGYLIGADSNIPLCERLLIPLLRDYPQGALVLFFAARLCVVTAQIDNGIAYLNKSVAAQSLWRQYHHVCFWELMFAHAYERDWAKATYYAKQLYEENKWSRATYAYMTAIFMHAQYDTLGVADRGYMTSLCEKVPSLRIRIAGKSIPVEKFCGMKARRYSLKGTLTLAHYELIYLWNGFNILGQKEELLKPILADIEAQIKRIESAQVRDQDDYCLCLLLKAMCFKHLQSPFQAEQCFKDIIDSESRLTDHRYLVPSSYFELALLRMDEDRLTETQQLLTKAREFKNYPLETRLHFRIHSAFEKLGVKTPSPTRL